MRHDAESCATIVIARSLRRSNPVAKVLDCRGACRHLAMTISLPFPALMADIRRTAAPRCRSHPVAALLRRPRSASFRKRELQGSRNRIGLGKPQGQPLADAVGVA